jgi:hypothetical protein
MDEDFKNKLSEVAKGASSIIANPEAIEKLKRR